MVRGRFVAAFAVGLLSLGFATTAFWLLNSKEGLALLARGPSVLVLGLVGIAALTTLNLAIRWLRWHFLLRRSRFFLRTRESLGIWLLSLPGLATPFYVGELVRSPLLARRFPRPFWIVLGIWFIERLADLYVLGFAVLALNVHWLILIGIGAVTALCISVVRLVPHARLLRTVTNPLTMAVILVATVLAWALPVLGLSMLLHQLGSPLPVADVVEAFGGGTLLGGFSGLPLGVGVAGSAMILSLQAHGVPDDTATIGIALFRAGTVWYAIGIAVAGLTVGRRFVLSLLRAEPARSHFDTIAESYGENLPPHIVRRLVDRKVEAMQARLSQADLRDYRRGLDVGCGQGWYVGKMVERGHAMYAVDLSRRQIAQAGAHLAGKRALAALTVADVSRLPYPDGAFDFAFGVNVIHHIAAGESRRAAFNEILRVLKPGGHFLLHEINTGNPLFRFYMGYIFPLLRDIDEGTEEWLDPAKLPAVKGGSWGSDVDYFSFLPDFTPAPAMRWLVGLEGLLERSRWRKWSSHYMACLSKP